MKVVAVYALAINVAILAIIIAELVVTGNVMLTARPVATPASTVSVLGFLAIFGSSAATALCFLRGKGRS